MTENQMYTALIATINAGLTLAAVADVDVRQAYQPSITGRPPSPAILFSNQPSQRYGFLKRDDVWDLTTQTMTHIETQVMTTTFQCGALAEQNPSADPATALTAGDLVSRAARILQSDAGREQLRAAGLGILRITEIRAPYFKNDQDTFEASPSFDFTLTHLLVDMSPGVPVATADGTLAAI